MNKAMITSNTINKSGVSEGTTVTVISAVSETTSIVEFADGIQMKLYNSDFALLDTWKIGYITRKNDIVYKVVEAVSVHAASVICMEADCEYVSYCYSECLTYRKE